MSKKHVTVRISGEVGSGKSTIARLLADTLSAAGIEVKMVDEDGDTAGMTPDRLDFCTKKVAGMSEVTIRMFNLRHSLGKVMYAEPMPLSLFHVVDGGYNWFYVAESKDLANADHVRIKYTETGEPVPHDFDLEATSQVPDKREMEFEDVVGHA